MRVIEKADITPMEPILCSIKAGTVLLGVSDRLIVDLIATGKIKAVKAERRTLLVVESLKQYAAGLNAAKGTPLARRRLPRGLKGPHTKTSGDHQPMR